MSKAPKVLYIACTPDKYELPLFVAESAQELGGMLGITKQHVFQYISRTAEKNRKGRPTKKMLRFYKVIFEDGERCPTCGRLFTPRSTQQIYCTKRCRPSASGRKEDGHGL
jgi:hypothetical protein